MSRATWIILGIVVLVVLGVYLYWPEAEVEPVPAPPPEPTVTQPPPPPPRAFEEVTLEYEGPEDPCALANYVTVFQDRPVNVNAGKPTKVRWKVHSDDQGLYRWELTYDSSKVTTYPAEDLIEVKPIDCSTANQKVDSKPVKTSATTTTEWPYVVTVWGCPYTEGDDYLCQSDPSVIIKDQ